MTILSTDAGVAQRSEVFAARDMLEHAKHVMVLEKFADIKSMPKNKGVKVKFRRPVVMMPATTPLLEGQTPVASSFHYEDEEATLRQYGDWVEITDVIEDTHEDNVFGDIKVQLGENMGRTMEALRWAELTSGTSVVYGNGASRSVVNTTITKSKQRGVVRALKGQHGQMLTRILDGSDKINTTPIEASYIAFCHTDMEADIRELPKFVPTSEYGSRKVVSTFELGTCENVRYVTSPDLAPIPDAGGTAGGMMSTSGTRADIYPVIFIAQHAFGTVPLRGFGSVDLLVNPVNKVDSQDPLGQRGSAGWKTWHCTKILNQAWIQRGEFAVTNLD